MKEKQMNNNIILIGMPACGKSTLGVVCAKMLGLDFLDTDILLQKAVGKPLQAIIDEDGLAVFKEWEQKVLCGVQVTGTLIATGGSAVYYPGAMAHLKSLGRVVYIQLSYEDLIKRLRNLASRGVAMQKGQSIRELYEERRALYEMYADVIFTPDPKLSLGENAEILAGVLEK